MEIKARTKLGRNTRAVSSIRFSKDGKYFFCTDKHNDSNVYCFNAEDASLLGTNKCGSDPVFDGDAGNGGVFAVAAKRGTYFFTYEGGDLDKKKGIFNGHSMESMITITYNNDSDCFYSGTAKGSIYQWNGNTCSGAKKMHQGSVRGLQYSNGFLLSSGSRDKKLIVSKDLEALKEFDIPSHAVSLDFFHGKYLVATHCGKIMTIADSTGESKQIMQGHSTGETWGLAIGPNGMVYSTADDNQILQFNPKTRKVEAKGTVAEKRGRKFRIGGASTLSPLPPNQHSRAVAINNKTGHVAIGTNDGTLSVRTLDVIILVNIESR